MPPDCRRRSEGEGSRVAAPGSDDDDDLYVADFGAPGQWVGDPERDLLADSKRRLMLWQVDYGQLDTIGGNSLVLAKDRSRQSVLLQYR